MSNLFRGIALACRVSPCLSLCLASVAGAQNYALTEDAPSSLYHVRITNDGQRVVYSGREPGFAYELFSVPLAGDSAPILLDMGVGAADFLVTPDSSRALHRVAGGLVSSPLDGSAAVQLHVLTGPGDVGAYLVSPDSNWAVFESRPIGGINCLLSVPLDGGQAATVLYTGPLLADFKITPDSARVLHRFALPGGYPYDLYSIPIDGSGETVSLSDMIPQGFNDVHLYEITPDGSRVVFSTEDNTLNSIAVDGVQGDDLRIYGIDSTFLTFELSSDGARTVYIDGGHASSAPVDGGSTPISLDGPDTPYGPVEFATISPDASTVIYVSDVRSPNRFELYSVPIDGSQAPVRLSGNIVSGGTVVFDWAPPVVSPDNTTVVYLADQEVDERFELYSVPIDGSAAPTKLNAELAPNGDVAFTTLGYKIRNGFRISPDSLRVAYIADQAIDERFEIFSVALNGGPSRRVNGPLVSGGDVSISGSNQFGFSPDGRRILYRADQEVDGDTQLYATVIAPGLTRVRPSFGPPEGANHITLRGSGFTTESTVTFGGIHAPAVTVRSPTELLVQVPATDSPPTSSNPPFTPGSKIARVPPFEVDVAVSDGISTSTLVKGYRYVSPTNR